MKPLTPVHQITLNPEDDTRTVLPKKAPHGKDKNKRQIERAMTTITVIVLLVLMLALTATLLIGLFKLAVFLLAL